MTKLERALAFKNYVDNHPPYKVLLKQLGWEKEMSWQQLRRMIINLTYDTPVSYCRELKVLEILEGHKGSFMWTQDIINECGFGLGQSEPTHRTMRRYIKDLRAAGIKIESKRGKTENGLSGYKLID